MIHRPGLLVLLQRDNADEGIAVLGDMNPLGAYAGQTDAPFSPFLKPRKTAGVALSSSSFRRSGVVGSDQIKLSSGATAAKSSGCRIMRIANFGTYPTSAFIKWVPMDIIPFPDTIFMGKSGYRESLLPRLLPERKYGRHRRKIHPGEQRRMLRMQSDGRGGLIYGNDQMEAG
jgi:hypothetical protein